MPNEGWRTYEDRLDWLAGRRRGLGSSDAAAILGANKYASGLDVWRDKVGLKEAEPDNRFTKAGRFLEPAIAEWFEEETGLDTFNPGDYSIFWDREHPPLACTPDRIIPEPSQVMKEACGLEGTEGDGVLEIKTASQYLVDEWGTEPPLHYQIQVQHQLGVLGLSWGIIAVLVGGNDFRWFVVKKNDNFVGAMRLKLLHFWEEYVSTEKEPPADMPRDLKSWEQMHPGKEDHTVELPTNLIVVDERIQEIKKEEKALVAERKKAEATLKQAIGDCEFGNLPNGVSFSYRTIEIAAKKVQRKASKFRKLSRRNPK